MSTKRFVEPLNYNQTATPTMIPDDFRRIALSLPGAIESAHMGHPDFRANGKIFATLQANDDWGMVKVTPEEQHELMLQAPKTFVPSSGAWGRQGCTNVRLDLADETVVRGALILAWEQSAKRPSAARARPAKRR